MTRHRIVLLEEHKVALDRCVFDRPDIEGAAFVLCGQARTTNSEKLISHSVVPVAPDEYLRRDQDGLSISSRALTRVAKRARSDGLSVIFAHSHPHGPERFSTQDDHAESRLIPFLQGRVANRLHGTLVITRDGLAGRIYKPRLQEADVLVVGSRLRLYSVSPDCPAPKIFDRQVRAFGPEVQRILSSLHIGIVGLGGTGSAAAEQLYRLGVGELSLFDGDNFDATNINRVYGSRLDDVNAPKVEIAERHLNDIGLGTPVHAIAGPITVESTARRLRDCDVVFGCTDKETPRAILTQLALKYHIPVFDLAALIDSTLGTIRGVYGRVTTLMAGEACLFCRGRITAEGMRTESLSPEERQSQAREGYAPELAEPAPAVIAFTAAVASFAVSELLNRLTGFMGTARKSSEVLLTFDRCRTRTNRVEPDTRCGCGDRTEWGRGDESMYLGLAWPTHTT